MVEQTFYVEKIRKTTKGGGLVTYRTNVLTGDFGGGGGSRGVVTEFSAESRKRLAFVASNADCQWLSMITLTYHAYPETGSQVKRDLNAFLTYLKKLLPGVKIIWFLEFQKRGAPHVHILTNRTYVLSVGEKLAASWTKKACKYTGNPVVKEHIRWFNSSVRVARGCGGTKFWQNSKSPGGLSHYAVKYAAKMEQKTIPANFQNVGRLWGGTRGLVVFLPPMVYCKEIQPKASNVFPNKPLRGLPKYIFGD